MQACIGNVEYALRLLQKAALARQARVSAQTPEGMRSLLSRGGGRGGAGESQSSGTVSEASDDVTSFMIPEDEDGSLMVARVGVNCAKRLK